MGRIGYAVQCVGDVPPDAGWLAPPERAMLSGMRNIRRRSDWLLGRWTAKRAVAAALDGAPAPGSIAVVTAASGAPSVVVDGRPGSVSISITHRDGIGACAVAPAPARVGCDLEVVEARGPAFAADSLSETEAALAAAWPDPDLAVTLLWSAKESVLKAIREGFGDARAVEVRAAPAGDPVWAPLGAVLVGSGVRFPGWWRLERGLVFTVVADRDLGPPRSLLAGIVA